MATLATPVPGTSLAQAPVINREPEIKATFIAKFAKYFTWPQEAFGGPHSPLVIGVLGRSPVGDALGAIGARKLLVDKRILTVKRAEKPDDLDGCQIVFLSMTVPEKDRIDALNRLKGKPVLIVGEDPRFLADGGLLSFAIERNRVTGSVSLKACERQRLKVSADLLQVFKPID